MYVTYCNLTSDTVCECYKQQPMAEEHRVAFIGVYIMPMDEADKNLPQGDPDKNLRQAL